MLQVVKTNLSAALCGEELACSPFSRMCASVDEAYEFVCIEPIQPSLTDTNLDMANNVEQDKRDELASPSVAGKWLISLFTPLCVGVPSRL